MTLLQKGQFMYFFSRKWDEDAKIDIIYTKISHETMKKHCQSGRKLKAILKNLVFAIESSVVVFNFGNTLLPPSAGTPRNRLMFLYRRGRAGRLDDGGV